MNVYYNEIDQSAVAWLRQLMERGQIPHGFIDTRSIVEVRPDDLDGFDQCHFFAGIGGWSRALALSDWPEDKAVWTGSCPCQPFSVAGKGKGVEDERHLWPEFARLIAKCQPPVIFGEQVASKAGKSWLSTVRLDLEGMGYGVGAADLCAAGVGAPHIRQRLYWVANVNHQRSQRSDREDVDSGRREEETRYLGSRRSTGGLAHTSSERRIGINSLLRPESRERAEKEVSKVAGGSERGWLGFTDSKNFRGKSRTSNSQKTETGHWSQRNSARSPSPLSKEQPTGSKVDSYWGSTDWLFCRDGKWRPVEPSTFPLAHGVPARVGRLRGYGNAIVPQVAEVFIRSFIEATGAQEG